MVADDVIDRRYDIYELALAKARGELLVNTQQYRFMTAHPLDQFGRARASSRSSKSPTATRF